MSGPLNLNVDTSHFVKLADAFRAAGKSAPAAMARGINATGLKARTEMRRALVAQTGLKYGVFVRALKSKAATPGNLRFEIKSRGGNVRLKFFRPRETRAGVVAVPWNRTTLFPGAFMKGGHFPKRVKLNMGGEVFQRKESGRLPIEGGRSGLEIPEEMVRGLSRAAFEKVTTRDLQDQTVRALYAILSGVPVAGR